MEKGEREKGRGIKYNINTWRLGQWITHSASTFFLTDNKDEDEDYYRYLVPCRVLKSDNHPLISIPLPQTNRHIDVFVYMYKAGGRG